MKELYTNLKEVFNKEKNITRFIFVLFIISVVVGCLFVNFISKSDKTLLLDQLDNYLSNISLFKKSLFSFSIYKDSLLTNLILISLIFVFGMSIVGVLIIILYIFYEGFALGINVSAFILKFGIKGGVGVGAYTLCTLLRLIPLYLITFFAIFISIKFIKAFIKKDNLNFKSFLGKYLLIYIICFTLILITSMCDTYLLTLLMKLFTIVIQ